ncbi:MAG: PAS domain S-box protein [Acidobacteriota bacterium]
MTVVNGALRQESRQDPATTRAASWRTDWRAAGLCGALYFAGAQVARGFVIQPEGLAVVWPSAGVLLGFLLYTERRAWPAILLVVGVVVTLTSLAWGNALPLSLGFASGNTFGPFAAATVTRMVVGRVPRIDDTRDVGILVAVVAFGTPVTALAGALAATSTGGASFWSVWQVWWLEDAMGMLVVTPLVLGLSTMSWTWRLRWPRADPSALVAAVGTVATSVWVFLLPPQATWTYLARPYLPVPFVGYLALRFGPRGAILSNLCLATTVLAGLAFDVGAFETFAPSNRDQAIGAQLFLAVTCVTTLVAGAIAAQRRRTEESLRLSEARLAEAQLVARVGSWRVEFGPDGEAWTVSAQINRIWGQPQGTQANMKRWFALMHPEDRARVAEAWTLAIEQPSPAAWDHRIVVDGEERWVAVHARVEIDLGGRPLALAGTMQDVTDRKRIENDLRAAEAKYRLVTENASDVIWLLDVDANRFVYVSPSVLRLRGYTPDEVMAQSVDLSLTPESQARVAAQTADALPAFLEGQSTGGPFVTMVDQPTKAGGVVSTEVTTRYIRESPGGKTYIVGVSRDISERKLVEDRIAQLAREQAAVLSTVPLAICLVVDRQIVWVNPAIKALAGYSVTEMIGMDTAELFPTPEAYQETGRVAYASLATGETFSVEMLLKRKSGETRWAELTGRYVDVANPENGAIWVVQDVTARKHADQQLRRFADAQRVLLQEVNHRVKNNLSALLGMVHLEQDRATASGEAAVDRAMRELDARLRSLATVHAMLSSSEWQPVRLDALCEKVISGVVGLTEHRANRVRVSGSAVVVDANQAQNLALVLSELAANTLKYGADPERPAIVVTVERAASDVVLTYQDEGPGFPAAVLAGDREAVHVGLELIRGLVHQSLRGELTLSNRGGVVVTVQFPLAIQGES